MNDRLNGLGYLRIVTTPSERTDMPSFEDEPPIEYSPLGREVTREGVTVRVLIYRVLSLEMRWTLEIEDHFGGSTCWEIPFATAQEAYDVFEHHVKLEGIRSFTEPATRP